MNSCYRVHCVYQLRYIHVDKRAYISQTTMTTLLTTAISNIEQAQSTLITDLQLKSHYDARFSVTLRDISHYTQTASHLNRLHYRPIHRNVCTLSYRLSDISLQAYMLGLHYDLNS